jgi:hypothetical protein
LSYFSLAILIAIPYENLLNIPILATAGLLTGIFKLLKSLMPPVVLLYFLTFFFLPFVATISLSLTFLVLANMIYEYLSGIGTPGSYSMSSPSDRVPYFKCFYSPYNVMTASDS